jgi:hypothetical protein
MQFLQRLQECFAILFSLQVGSLVGMISGFMLMGDPEDFLSAHGHELQLQVEKETKEEMKVLSKVSVRH